jgi:hypothetical protein
MEKGEDWVVIVIREVYDGWSLQFNQKTKEFKWRDAWFVDKLTDEYKKEIEESILKNIKKK